MTTEKIEDDNRALFKIHSEKCIKCFHLFPTYSNSKAHNSCHFKNGNSMCPAQEVKIVVNEKVSSKTENLRKSFEEDDIQGVIEQLKKVVKLSPKERKGILSNLIATDKSSEEPKKSKKTNGKNHEN